MSETKKKKKRKKLVWEAEKDYSLYENRLNRGEAIKLKCLDCMCNDRKEVVICEIVTCPLWRFRLGREQNRKPEIQEVTEQKEEKGKEQ
jgi:hypothetical protein